MWILGIDGIGGCVNLKMLWLNECSSLTGLFSGHHPMMILISTPSFAAVPNIEELKNLETLNLSRTGITGTVDFDHHPMMITDFNCASQTSKELKGASI